MPAAVTLTQVATYRACAQKFNAKAQGRKEKALDLSAFALRNLDRSRQHIQSSNLNYFIALITGY